MLKYFISRSRKNEIKDIVLDILKSSNIHSLPIRINNILKHYKIECVKIDEIATRNSKDADTQNDDGYVIKNKDKYIIVYNPTHSPERIRFTLACQIAHIFLGHLSNKISNKASDLEATYFADELLMPLSVLDSYGARTAEDIKKRCGVSFTAAKIREKDFVRRDKYKKVHGETEYDIEFLNCFFGTKEKQ